MKKYDISYLIDLYKSVKNNEKISSIENNSFPKIKPLEKEIAILIKEKNIRSELYEKQIKILHQLQKNCTHEVRQSHPSTFGVQSRHCIICGKHISSDNHLEWSYDDRINSYYCNFPENYTDDGDYYEGVDVEVVYNYINEILRNKNDDDQIDLVQEMKKLYPEHCTYVEKEVKKQYNILIIGGSNIIDIDKDHYLTSSSYNIAFDLTHYFLGIPKTKVKILENPKSYLTQNYRDKFPHLNMNYGAKFVRYTSKEELIDQLKNSSKECPFDLIIDISKIFEMSIQDNKLSIDDKRLDLRNLFPTSKIVRFENIFENLIDYNKEQILTILKKLLLGNVDMVVGYHNEYVDKLILRKGSTDETYKTVQNLDDVGDNIKTLILKK